MALSLGSVRKFVFQNATSLKLYEVVLTQAAPGGAITGRGLLLGTSKVNSDPALDNTEVTFVVLTAQVGKVFGAEKAHDTALSQGAFFNVSNPAGVGAALSTLLV